MSARTVSPSARVQLTTGMIASRRSNEVERRAASSTRDRSRWISATNPEESSRCSSALSRRTVPAQALGGRFDAEQGGPGLVPVLLVDVVDGAGSRGGEGGDGDRVSCFALLGVVLALQLDGRAVQADGEGGRRHQPGGGVDHVAADRLDRVGDADAGHGEPRPRQEMTRSASVTPAWMTATTPNAEARAMDVTGPASGNEIPSS